MFDFISSRGSWSRVPTGSNETTQKYDYRSISSVKSEEIVGDEAYHIVAVQLGESESSTIYLYYVPAQYVEAIKDELLGQWG